MILVQTVSEKGWQKHVFSGPTGVLIQQHHYQARPAGEPASRNDDRENGIKENGTSIMNNNHSIYQVDGKLRFVNYSLTSVITGGAVVFVWFKKTIDRQTIAFMKLVGYVNDETSDKRSIVF